LNGVKMWKTRGGKKRGGRNLVKGEKPRREPRMTQLGAKFGAERDKGIARRVVKREGEKPFRGSWGNGLKKP